MPIVFNEPSTTAATTSVKVIDDISQMPSPVLKDGVLTIIPNAVEYLLNKPISSPYPISMPLNGGRCTIRSVNRSIWTYTGTDSCFRDVNADGKIELIGLTEFQSPNGNMWDFNNTVGGSG